MNARRFSVALIGSLLVGTSLFAQAPQPGAWTGTPARALHEENRAQRQQNRPAQGGASGSLAPKEAARLEHQEAKTNLNGAKTQSNGQVTMKEPARLHPGQNTAMRRIIRQKHDARNVK